MINHFQKLLFLIVIVFTSNYSIGQTKEETLEYINTKQEVYQHKNSNGDLFAYITLVRDTNGVKQLVLFELAALSGDIYNKDYYYTDIKNITAIEYATDEIGRKQIKVFAKSPGFEKLDLLFEEVSYDTVVEMTFSASTEPDQIKSLIKSYKHLVKLQGGKDLTIEKF